MIGDLLLGLLDRIMMWTIDGLFDHVPSPPGWFFDGLAAVSELWAFAQQFDTWIPVTMALAVGAAVVVTYLGVVVILLIRMIVSYVTLGGGAT